MSDVGDLLELLYDAGERWQTVQATVRVWQHVATGERATQRWLRQSSSGSSHVMHLRAASGEERPEAHEHALRIWIEKLDRWRQEHDDHVAVGRGGLWWSRSPYYGLLSNEDDPESGHSSPLEGDAALLDPVHLVPALRFVEIARDDGVVVVRALPRPTRGFVPGLPPGADEYVLTVDATRGVVLRVESFFDGERFNVSELGEPVWDVPLGDDVFTLEPEPGEAVQSPRRMHERLTIDEAAARASFAVFAIGELPEGRWRVDAHYSAAIRERPESLHLMYHRSDARGQITVGEHPARPEGWTALESVAHLVVERDGTFVVISSDNYDEDVLRRLADGLVRV